MIVNYKKICLRQANATVSVLTGVKTASLFTDKETITSEEIPGVLKNYLSTLNIDYEEFKSYTSSSKKNY